MLNIFAKNIWLFQKNHVSLQIEKTSARATKFRQWATSVLKEFIKKGFVLDEERLKQGNAVFGKDYFRELLEKVRSIRASERRVSPSLFLATVAV
jgi:hypothetical protein